MSNVKPAQLAVVDCAKNLVGTSFRAGESAQCANFVRYVFRKAGVNIGVAEHPSDEALLPGEPQGASYANSFAGNDVGKKIYKVEDLQAGDVIMWRNTYGDFANGVITHVGIMVDSKHFVHRPTASRPVECATVSGTWATLFVEGRRPLAYSGKGIAKVFVHDGKAAGIIEGRTIDSVFKVFGHDGKGSAFAGKIGSSALPEFKNAQIELNFGNDIIHCITVNEGKYKVTRADGAVSENVPMSCVLVVSEGKCTCVYNIGCGEVQALGGTYSVNGIFRD